MVLEDKLESPLDLVTFCMSGSIFLVVFHLLSFCCQGEALSCPGDAGAALEEGVSWQFQNFASYAVGDGQEAGQNSKPPWLSSELYRIYGCETFQGGLSGTVQPDRVRAAVSKLFKNYRKTQ